jgi:hypothetical protein
MTTILRRPTTMNIDEVLWEIEAIKQLKARYFRLLDTRDWDGWTLLFTENCEFRTSRDPDEVIVGRETFVPLVRSSITPGISVHHGHMPEITLTSPVTATGIWAMYDYVQGTPAGGPPLLLHGYGHYHEAYRKEADGEWRISSLRLTRLRVDH